MNDLYSLILLLIVVIIIWLKYKNMTIIDIYDFFAKYISPKIKKTFKTIFLITTPTLGFSWYLSHENLIGSERKKSLVVRNYFYLVTSIVALFSLEFFTPLGMLGLTLEPYVEIGMMLCVWILPWSRCNEILYAFIKDALDKAGNEPPKSNLSSPDRIKLTLLSYIELIINYAILYYVMPLKWFDSNVDDVGKLLNNELSPLVFNSIFDAVYFSGVTITTLGYGDFSPNATIPKLMVIHEVLTGFTLIVVSFAIYAGKGGKPRVAA